MAFVWLVLLVFVVALFGVGNVLGIAFWVLAVVAFALVVLAFVIGSVDHRG